jgi:hypothetical protein
MLRKWRESFDEKLKQLRLLQDRMAAATSYAEWREFAQQVCKAGMPGMAPVASSRGCSDNSQQQCQAYWFPDMASSSALCR